MNPDISLFFSDLMDNFPNYEVYSTYSDNNTNAISYIRGINDNIAIQLTLTYSSYKDNIRKRLCIVFCVCNCIGDKLLPFITDEYSIFRTDVFSYSIKEVNYKLLCDDIPLKSLIDYIRHGDECMSKRCDIYLGNNIDIQQI